MGFLKHQKLAVEQRMALFTHVIADAEVVKDGAAVNFGGANANINLAASGEKVLGIARTGGSTLTGDDSAPVSCQVEYLMAGDLFLIPQAAISDANSQPGDQLDLAADGAAVAADSNHDLRVIGRKTINQVKYLIVCFLNRQIP